VLNGFVRHYSYKPLLRTVNTTGCVGDLRVFEDFVGIAVIHVCGRFGSYRIDCTEYNPHLILK